MEYVKRFLEFLFTALAVLAAALAITAGFAKVCGIRTVNPDRLYPLTARVSEIDPSADTVVFEDSMGFRWAMSGIEDWQPGDGASLLMHDNGTETIYDDIIITARYSTWNLSH